jgi:putative membrane protein
VETAGSGASTITGSAANPRTPDNFEAKHAHSALTPHSYARLRRSKMPDPGPDKEKTEERIEENIFQQDLKLADKLAIERTVLAADRTMLAGVRTSMSFIGFGFTIFNLLKYIQEHTPLKFMRPQTPRNFGLFMLVAGTLPLFVMIIQYSRILKRLGKKEHVFGNPNLQMAGVIFVLGIILLISMVGNIFLL